MNFGLSDNVIEMIVKAVLDFDRIERVVIFGSRAIGNYKNGSDVDMAVFGNNIDFSLIAELNYKLNELLPIPYYFDVIGFDLIESQALKTHIIEFGKTLYEKNKGSEV